MLKSNVGSYNNCFTLNCIVNENTLTFNGVNLHELFDCNPGGNCTYEMNDENKSHIFKVNTITLDSIKNYYDIAPNVVKINTNRDNLSVIKSMNNIIKEHKPRIYISINEDIEKIQNILYNDNYKSEHIGNNTKFFYV